MAEDLIVNKGNKAAKYETLLKQLSYLIDGETSTIANLANISAGLKETFEVLWAGFYLVEEGELVLGPFQGPIACTRIGFGKGVCGTAWKSKEAQLVPDVNAYPGHIACSSLTKSEVVIPLFTNEGNVWGVLDLDHEELNAFNKTDVEYLEKLAQLLKEAIGSWK